MAKYQIYFDTVAGEQKFHADIDDEETLDDVINDLLAEMREYKGLILKGEGEGELQVSWNGGSLDFSTPLADQGVKANDVLRVSVVVLNG